MNGVRNATEPLDPLNLARRPFANGRPVVRVSLLLGLLGALLLVMNVAGYWRYLADSEAKRAERDRVAAEREQIERRIADLNRQLEGIDLERQNLQVGFLNQRIAERKFSWSTLLDRVARELPGDVRLKALLPKKDDVRGRQAASAAPAGADGRIPLQIEGQSKSVQAMLTFVDHLFARPEFVDPDPKGQQEDEAGLITFNLSVDYLPAVAANDSATMAAIPAGAGERGDGR